ncbi:MAG: CapA family protein [Spirochaetales bacterium]
MRILIGADMVPTKSNMNSFTSGKMDDILDVKLIDCLKSADYRIFNLEIPLTDHHKPIKKCGPNLISPLAAVKGYQAVKANLLTLANNHIMDQGEQGLYSTLKALDGEGISHVGAGSNLENAQRPFILEKEGLKIGIYACAEHEFSIAEKSKAGANPFDCPASYLHVSELKKHCDKVIVLYHGGKEHYRYPSPGLRKSLKGFAKAGADLVIAQHSHCIGCMEKFKGAEIIYGQGNFLFDGDKNPFWNTSLLIQADISRESAEVSYVPLERCGSGVRISDNDSILRDFKSRSKEILQDGFVEKSFDKFVSNYFKMIIEEHSGAKKFMLRIFIWFLRHLVGRRLRLMLLNYVECESLNEVLVAGLKTSV